VVAATAASGRAADARAVPLDAPLLDEMRGKSAATAYRAFIAGVCNSISRGTPIATPLAGLDDADEALLCAVQADAKPVASGSLVHAGADEVLLDTPSGGDHASGERALVLMRNEGKGYRFVAREVVGNGFRPIRRFTVTGSVDVLMLCAESGHMGLYPSTCGFFGRGTFLPAPPRGVSPTGRADELDLIQVQNCGPATWVRLGRISLQTDALAVELIVEKTVMKPNPPDEGEGGPSCSRKTKVATRRFSIAYKFDGKNFRRVTRIPAAVQKALAEQN